MRIFIMLAVALLGATAWYKNQNFDADRISKNLKEQHSFESVDLIVQAPFWECGVHAYAYAYFYGRRKSDARLYEGVACHYPDRLTLTIFP